jgi:hypothetical protein
MIMGTYFRLVNHSKKEFMDPEPFGSGNKALELKNMLLGLGFMIRQGWPWASDSIELIPDIGDDYYNLPETHRDASYDALKSMFYCSWMKDLVIKDLDSLPANAPDWFREAVLESRPNIDQEEIPCEPC